MSEPDKGFESTTEANQKLRTFVERLKKFLETIDAKGFAHDDWYANLVAKLVSNVGRVCRALYQTTDQEEALPAAAWNARNLLELWIWVTYCSASRENARRFHEDVIRDALGLRESVDKMCGLIGMVNEFEDESRQRLKQIALEHGVEAFDTNYTKVAAAAKAVGLHEWFGAYNVHLSKFAHPTAGLVIGIMHQSNAAGKLQATCVADGVFFAGQSVKGLERMVTDLCSSSDAGTKTSAATP